MKTSQIIKLEQLKNIEDVRDYLDQAIQEIDLDSKNPPYTSEIYHPLRKKIFLNYKPLITAETREDRNQIIYYLSQVVDEEMLNMFQMLLSKPYQELIMTQRYGIPREIEFEKAQKGSTTFQALQTLVSNISEWNIQIERTVDSIQKVTLYRLWEPAVKQREKQLTAELKALLSPNNEFSYSEFSKHILLNVLAQGAEKFGKALYSAGLSESNLSYGAVLLIYHSIVGHAALPWHVILPSLNIKWLLGGVLGSFALGKVADYISAQDEIEQVLGCAKVFREISQNLVEFNEKVTEAVNDCLLTVDEDDETKKRQILNDLIESFLEEPEIIKQGGDQLITANDVIEHEDEDWLVLSHKQQKQEIK